MPTACPGPEHEAATRRHAILFFLALAFLVLMAFSLHSLDPGSEPFLQRPWLGGLLLALWIPIFLEALIGYWRRGEYSWKAAGRLALIWLLPPYRLALSTHPGGTCLWLPIVGWQRPDYRLFDHMERGFGIPMLLIALLILPILAIEIFGARHLWLHPELRRLLNFGTSLIWLAFAFEFIMMSAVAEAKIRYLTRNWINLVIILIPLFAFLRGFQAARLLRLGKTARLLKMYRLRGLGMRAWRGVIALELIERLLHRDPEIRLARLKTRLRDKQRELLYLCERIRELESHKTARRPAAGGSDPPESAGTPDPDLWPCRKPPTVGKSRDPDHDR